ncbi:MAG TPA: biotin carboxylase N-terminal domain-containing protein [Streptosporangiaceae bacterium]|nr:biotin carboxylase N-terminal domain-containing protein [Streptosporangiaceae bacterium]
MGAGDVGDAGDAGDGAVDVLNRVLMANRSEIARRVFRTCRELGVSTVAVYSDADAGAAHVTEADAAVRLPGTAPADTYLRADLLVEAALRTGADAVHPGYGFLSENAAFARLVQGAGLTWIGPPPDAIEVMGIKTRAKRLMAAAGVPVLPELDPASLTEADLPVLIKASAGGGGRGMRIVRSLAALPAELEAARSEAAAAFGDPAVFCEPYLAAGRHIEVQILADDAGTVWTVGERECSIQRRHQKIIEEAPSPLVAGVPEMRERVLAAARAAALAARYRSAGTVEFLADGAGRFYFLEMNTRLQVEHPVTECTTGLDLVALQLRIAAGRPLPAPVPPPASGHAIEARLYAEDPAAGWQPQSGTLYQLAVPGRPTTFRVPSGRRAASVPAIRLDSGVTGRSHVGVHYDPLLAKVIAWAPDREQAAALLSATLARTKIHGLVTNRNLLVRVLRHPAFLAGQTDTAFLDTHDVTALAAPLANPQAIELSVLAAALADAAARRAAAAVLGGLPSGWRNVPSALQRKAYDVVGTGPAAVRREVGYRIARDGLLVDGRDDITLVSMAPDAVLLAAGGVQWRFEVAAYPGLICVDSELGPVALRPVPRFGDPAGQVAAGSLLAPMPGTVSRLGVAVGSQVAAGEPLLWLEAMKMEHVISAPAAGIVAELPVVAGQHVEVGSVLAIVKPEEDPA